MGARASKPGGEHGRAAFYCLEKPLATSRGLPFPAVNHDARLSQRPEFPVDVLGCPLCTDAPAVNAEQVAPGADGRQILGLFAATLRSKAQVVRRDVPARAD